MLNIIDANNYYFSGFTVVWALGSVKCVKVAGRVINMQIIHDLWLPQLCACVNWPIRG